MPENRPGHLLDELDEASVAAGHECWCGRHPEECEEAGGCAWSRELARVRAAAGAAEREQVAVALESLARDVTAFAPPSDGWNGPQRSAIQWGIRHAAHRLRNGTLTGGDGE